MRPRLLLLLPILALTACPDPIDGDDDDDAGEEVPVDGDGDGVPEEDDCDDTDPDVFPGAEEICNDIDDDCNGEVDDGLEFLDWYPDVDEDTFGDEAAEPVSACARPSDGHVTDGTDCDDTDPSIFPGAEDLPGDGIDQDCTGLDAGTCFEDLDEDGHGSTTVVVNPSGDCEDVGFSLVDDDCDDTDPSIFPGATDVVGDGIDQDCSGEDTVICYVDADGDTFGSSIVTTSPDGECTAQGLSDNDLDCDDDDPDEFPGQVWYEDFDNDTYGNLLVAQIACEQPAGFVLDDSDCDDVLDTVNPAGVEVCDGLDNDCLNGVDDGFADLDVDGIADCVDDDDDGDGETDATDCDDTEATVCTTCPEICGDGLDNDCDPVTTCFDMSYTDAGGNVVSTSVEPLLLTQGFVSWYSYGNPAGSSSNTGYEVADRVVEMLVVDPNNGKVAVVMMSDLPNDGDGGSLTVDLSGFTNAQIAFIDDPGENSFNDLNSTTGLGTLTYAWAPCCNDGFVITDLDPFACVTIEMTASTGVVGLTTYDGTTRVDIPGSVNQPLTFCEGF